MIIETLKKIKQRGCTLSALDIMDRVSELEERERGCMWRVCYNPEDEKSWNDWDIRFN